MGKQNDVVVVELSAIELRYLVACGYGLIQNIKPESLPTYTTFTKDEIIAFSRKIRRLMDENDIDM